VLRQTYAGHIDCVVVVDQSRTELALPSPSGHGRTLRIVRNVRTPGLAGTRNTGILATDAPLVAFLDDDDEWLPEKLAHQVAALSREPEVGLVGCAIEIVLPDRTIVRPIPALVRHADLLRSRVIALNPSTLLARRALLEATGLVDEMIPGAYGEDWEWLLRALKGTDAVGLPEPLVRISWARTSWFAGRWKLMADGLDYLVERHPDLLVDDRGAARILGQIAFARAGAGQRSTALQYAARSLGRRLSEPRALLALGVAARIIPPDGVRKVLLASGRGV
jgi:glycosyltransferase involved in cell wall biosynthesis